MQFKLEFARWEDGQLVQACLEEPDRWAVHAAEEVLVTLGDLRLRIIQQPGQLTGAGRDPQRLGVAACLWDGALVLAGYVATLPRYKFIGARCVELGAGVGLVGLAAAAMGAYTTITDVGKVLPLMERNLEANSFGAGKRGHPGGGWAEASELEWGREGYLERAAALAPAHWVLSSDACYIDQDGSSPSTPAFVATCAALCGPATRCLVAFELRAPEVRECFVAEARRAFSRVDLLPLGVRPPALRLEYVDLWQLQL